MSPKRVTSHNDNTAAASEPRIEAGSNNDAAATPVVNIPKITEENLAADVSVAELSESADATDESPTESTGAARTTPAAQAANRARRIGGAGVRPAAEVAAAADLALPKPPTSLAKSEPDAADSARKRGMAGRPAAKSRVQKSESPTAATESSRGFRLGIEGIAASILAVIAVALAVVNVLVWHPWQHTDKTAQLRGQILASVNQGAALVLSYDYRKWDASAAAAEVYLTGQFKIDYSKAMTSSLKQTGISTQTVVVGKVDNSGLVSINSKGTQATVAVYAERSKTNTSNTTATVDLLALQITATKVGSKWQISQFGYIDG